MPARPLSEDLRAQILEARAAGFNKEDAARLLDISPTTVHKYWDVGVDFTELLRVLCDAGLALPIGNGATEPDDPGPLVSESGRHSRASRTPSKLFWVSDPHFPYQDTPAIHAALEVASDYKPDVYVVGGDVFDFYWLSEHDKSDQRAPNTQEELDSAKWFFDAIDGMHDEVWFFEGNHEHRMARQIAKNPALHVVRAFSDFRKTANIPERWHFFPSGTWLRVGKLTMMHGDIPGFKGGKHVAFNLLSKLLTSVVCGHYHRAQMYAMPTFEEKTVAAYTMGHLASTRGSDGWFPAAHWTQGFGIIEFDGDGNFEVEQVHIVKGRCRFRGKTYG